MVSVRSATRPPFATQVSIARTSSSVRAARIRSEQFGHAHTEPQVCRPAKWACVSRLTIAAVPADVTRRHFVTRSSDENVQSIRCASHAARRRLTLPTLFATSRGAAGGRPATASAVDSHRGVRTETVLVGRLIESHYATRVGQKNGLAGEGGGVSGR
jgi:hypothetical protein